MTSKKSILFFGEAASLAHITRPLVLAKSLDPLRYDIHFACDSRYQSLINTVPHIHYWPIRSIPGKTFVKAANRGGYVLQKKDIESYIGQEIALTKRVLPSLIVGDFRQTLTISSELTHIPYASLTNAYWSPFRILDFDPIARFPKYYVVRRRVAAALTPWIQQSATKSVNRVREKHGLAPLKDFCDLSTHGDYTLYLEPPGFIKTAPLPDNHLFLGPIFWEPVIAKPSWWQTWDAAKPLIYVTLGSTGEIERLIEIVHILKKFPATIVVSTAGRVNLKNVPNNVFAAEYLPGMEICKLASVVVCNGGSTTAYQALSQGTPVMGIWSNIDQYLSMKSIEHAGAGICCSTWDLDEKK
jgi:UDP:flavonoid glycosyltransferase YjiC (YdhE family)